MANGFSLVGIKLGVVGVGVAWEQCTDVPPLFRRRCDSAKLDKARNPRYLTVSAFGASPSGKATGFDPVIPRFES